MPPPKNNKYWQLRGSHGRPTLFPDSETLWNECCDYFTWVEDNPLEEEKLFAFQGVVTRDTAYKMRAMTVGGLCLHLGISQDTWENYRRNDNFIGVTTRVDAIIREQKFVGAAADLLNANIIARDLGLRDKQDVAHSGEIGQPDAADPIDTANRLLNLIGTALKRSPG